MGSRRQAPPGSEERDEAHHRGRRGSKDRRPAGSRRDHDRRQDGNTIRLTERNVSRRHARLVKENGNVLIEDLGSYNGVRVNGEKITGRTRIKEGDLVEIGDYDLGIQGKIDAPTMTLRPDPRVPRRFLPAR